VKCDYASNGIPVLRISNIAAGQLDLSDIKRATKDVLMLRGDELLSGDMLMCRINGSVTLLGKTAVVEDQLSDPHAFASYLLRFRFVELRSCRSGFTPT
jgi:type I restriction enzyme, S subunit